MFKQYLDSLNPDQRSKVVKYEVDPDRPISPEELHSVDWKKMYLERDLNLRLFFLEYLKEKHIKINGENNTNVKNNNDNGSTSNINQIDIEVENEGEGEFEKVDILDYIEDVAPYIR